MLTQGFCCTLPALWQAQAVNMTAPERQRVVVKPHRKTRAQRATIEIGIHEPRGRLPKSFHGLRREQLRPRAASARAAGWRARVPARAAARGGTRHRLRLQHRRNLPARGDRRRRGGPPALAVPFGDDLATLRHASRCLLAARIARGPRVRRQRPQRDAARLRSLRPVRSRRRGRRWPSRAPRGLDAGVDRGRARLTPCTGQAPRLSSRSGTATSGGP